MGKDKYTNPNIITHNFELSLSSMLFELGVKFNNSCWLVYENLFGSHSPGVTTSAASFLSFMFVCLPTLWPLRRINFVFIVDRLIVQLHVNTERSICDSCGTEGNWLSMA